MKSILILTDFSRQANYVAEFAISIAIINHSRLIFCHVAECVDLVAKVNSEQGIPVDECDHHFDLSRKLNDFNSMVEKNSLPGSYKPHIDCRTELGSFCDTAEKIVSKEEIDLVIIGSKKTRNVSRFQFGSQTYILPDKLNCPVLLIPEGLKFEGIQTIMYATDLPVNNRRALQFLGKLAKPFHAAIKVSHISKRSIPIAVSGYVISDSLNEQLGSDYAPVTYQSLKQEDMNTDLLQVLGTDRVNILALVHRKYQFLEGLFHKSLSKLMPDKSTIPLLILPNSFISEN